ncbi:MAG: carbamate kinase [Clostridia bacterium]|nr:carbamate kinase [Clostridia bacterium]
MSRMVVAIGGNALDVHSGGQQSQLEQAARSLVPLITSGNEIVLVHGNGPQVGIIHSTMLDAQQHGIGDGAPFYDCTAMNEGSIGWHFEQAIQRELEREGRADIPVCTVVTRVVVDADDPAFKDLEKPVGAFYDEATAKKLMQETGHKYAEDSGRGWRLMVASPVPKHIVEAETLKNLAASGTVVIGAGGAGIPVVRTGQNTYEGIEGVCDKDITSGLIAQLIDADLLIILTAVDRVSINFGKPDQIDLSMLTPDEAEKYIGEGQFPPGSMQPKVQACADFVRSRPDRKAVIANLNKAGYALTGQTGTIITNDAVSA